MSKVDALRALREAKYARTTAPSGPAHAQASLCGHRNMSGRSCTREADHLKTGTKNHRYG